MNYIADFYNNEVRKITVSTGIISAVAGNHAIGGGYSGDGGPAIAAEIETQNISVDKYGNMYIPDGNSLVRMVTASTGIITTVAGIYNFIGYSGDGGPATDAELDGPGDAVADSLGNIYISDDVNNVIRKVTNNTITTGVKQQMTENGIGILPNPSTGIFTLSLSNITEKYNIEIYNVLGERVLTQTLRYTQGDNLINLTNQPNGVYFYRVLTESGELIGAGKLVIE